MIGLSIKGEPESQKEFEGVVYLEQDMDEIDLMIEDKSGETWLILSLRSDGTIKKRIGMPNDIGLQVDDNGKIMEGESE